MPPSKRARKSAVASASTVGEASLLDLPTGWEKALSLPSLKQVAARSGLERGWQAVGKEHRADLVAALAQRAAEWRSFVASVLPLEVALQKATPQNIRRSTKPVDVARCAAIDAAVRAAVHLVPSGSGVHIGGGLVLTCAHCVDHDDDEDDDEDRDEGEPQKRDFAGGSSRPLTRTERVAYEAAVVAWRLAAPAGPERVGRLKMCVTASGVHRVGACVHVDEANDLALLRLEGAAPPAGLGALALGAEGDDAPGTAVLAVGNPCAGGSKRGTRDPSSAPRGAVPRPSRAPPPPCPAAPVPRPPSPIKGASRAVAWPAAPRGVRGTGHQRATEGASSRVDAQVRLGPRARERRDATEERLHSFLDVDGRAARRAGPGARPRQGCRPAAAFVLDVLGPQRLPDRARRRRAGPHRRAAQLVGRQQRPEARRAAACAARIRRLGGRRGRRDRVR